MRTGFGSGNSSDVIPFGGAAACGGTSGELMIAASAGSVVPAEELAGADAEGGLFTAACAFKSTGCSSELTTLTAAGLPVS